MKRHALRAYLICMLVCLGLFIMMIFTDHTMILGKTEDSEVAVLQNVEKTEYSTDAASGVERYTFTLGEITQTTSHLIFYTIHQNVTIYCDGKAIYSMNPDYKNAFNRSSGCIWVDIPLWQDYSGKFMRIEIEPVYESSKGRTPVFYIGTRQGIYKSILAEYLVQFITAMVLIILGAAYCIFIQRYRSNEDVDKSPAYIGFFAILIGIWKLSDMPSFRIAFAANPGAALLPFASIALVMYPTSKFFLNICREKNSKIWDILLLACDIHIAGIILLQYMNILDFRQTFKITMFLIIAGLLLIAFLMTKDFIKNGMTNHIKMNLICLFGCAVAVDIDMITYLWGGNFRPSNYAIYFFLVYVIVIGVIAYRQAVSLAREGRETKRYENQAYHDQLTGLYNRTAFEKDIIDYMNDSKRIIVINFDLNDLKQCNDKLGHEKGDIYIKDSADYIKECFGAIGNCYRSGGDEFHCLSVESNLNACKEAIEKLREKSYQYNNNGTDIIMSIAIGYAVFDKRIDYNFMDTMKRADKMMYQNKAEIKQMKGQKLF